MAARTPIPGQFLSKNEDGKPWDQSSAEIKRRHFVLDGHKLKLFGRRGKTYKGHINLLAVEALHPSTDATAPPGAFELQVRASSSRSRTCILLPDHSVDDVFMALGNAVPSDATSDALWRIHMGSRPAAAAAGPAHEYRMGKTLGTGTFGKVKLAQRVADGELFAVKCLNRARIVLASQSGRLAKEIRLLKLLNHPNVIRLHEVLHTNAEILMVMEYVPGGDLLDVLNTQPRFAEKEVRHIFGQVVCGVAFCHSLGVAHRDLKPENILIKRSADDGGGHEIKVADFGLSTLMPAGEFLKTACGSPHYVAPEILNFDGEAKYDGREADVWSLGVILHVMLCYKLPFEAESTQLLYARIRAGLPALPPSLTPSAASLLHGMLEVAPERRLSLTQVASHEWLRLQSETPRLSQLVDAVVAHDPGALEALAAASAVSGTAFDAAAAGGGGGGAGAAAAADSGVRRAFTFDVLPRAFSTSDISPAVSRKDSREASGAAAPSRLWEPRERLDADTPPASLPSSPLATRGAAGPAGGTVPEEFALPASGPPPANGVVVHGLG